jgi:mannose/fructose-specific phosphotransferase system component IIA
MSSVGVLVLGQGRLAGELVASVEAIAGSSSGLQHLDLSWQCEPEELKRQIHQAIASCNRGHGVLVLTPLSGDALSQQAAQSHPEVEVLGGVNLAMLLALVCSELRTLPLPQLVRELQERGRKAISTIEVEPEPR